MARVVGPDGAVVVSNVGGFQSAHDLLEPSSVLHLRRRRRGRGRGRGGERDDGGGVSRPAAERVPGSAPAASGRSSASTRGRATSRAVCAAHEAVRDVDRGERRIEAAKRRPNANEAGDFNKLHEHGGERQLVGRLLPPLPRAEEEEDGQGARRRRPRRVRSLSLSDGASRSRSPSPNPPGSDPLPGRGARPAGGGCAGRRALGARTKRRPGCLMGARGGPTGSSCCSAGTSFTRWRASGGRRGAARERGRRGISTWRTCGCPSRSTADSRANDANAGSAAKGEREREAR